MDKEKIEFIQYVYKTFCRRGKIVYLLPNNVYQDLENYRTTMETVAKDNFVTVNNVRQAWYLTKACEYARTEDSDVESKFFIHLMQTLDKLWIDSVKLQDNPKPILGLAYIITKRGNSLWLPRD